MARGRFGVTSGGMFGALLHIAAVVLVYWVSGRHRELDARRRWFAYGLAAAFVVAGILPTGWFSLSKWIGRVVMPPSLVLFGLMALVVRMRIRGRIGDARWVAVVAFIYWLCSNVNFASYLLAAYEAPYRDHPPVPEGGYQAVLVLGGGTMDRPGGDSQLTVSGDRVATVARMYHRGETALVVATGSNVKGMNTRERYESLGAQTAAVLQELGVPDAAVVQVPGPRNTKEEMAAMAKLVKERGWTRVAVVTSAYHLRRAMRHAARNDLAITPVGSDYKGRIPYVNAMNLLPSPRALDDTRAVCWELLGAAVGR